MRSSPLYVLMFLAGFSAGAAGAETRQPLSPDPAQPPPVKNADQPVADGTPHAWGLAADAVLTEENEMSHRLLGAQLLDEQARDYATDMLRKWWGVDNRDDLLQVLDDLEQRGQRSRFDRIAHQVDSLPGFLYPLLLFTSRTFTDDAHSLEVVHDNYRALGGKSLLGWDLMRFIDVNRKGYAAGYLAEEEAWANIMRASRRLQATFGSWKELGDNYLLGRNFWSESAYQQRLRWTTNACDRLLHDPQSPWVVNPWNMDLNQAPLPPAGKPPVNPASSGGSGIPHD